MQDNVVKAFRQRLVRNGFTDVWINSCGDDTYIVGCISPFGERIRRRMSPMQMSITPRLVWFD